MEFKIVRGEDYTEKESERNEIYIDEDTEDRIFEIITMRFASRAISYEYGRNRNVFNMGNYVVKIPKNFSGINDNEWEGSIENCNNDPENIRYARTRMTYYRDIPIVFMEYVKWLSEKEILNIFKTVPDWIYSVDCGQVGINRKSELVAFDYGL